MFQPSRNSAILVSGILLSYVVVYPIGSTGPVHLPTFTIKISQMYTIHGSYGQASDPPAVPPIAEAHSYRPWYCKQPRWLND